MPARDMSFLHKSLGGGYDYKTGKNFNASVSPSRRNKTFSISFTRLQRQTAQRLNNIQNYGGGKGLSLVLDNQRYPTEVRKIAYEELTHLGDELVALLKEYAPQGMRDVYYPDGSSKPNTSPRSLSDSITRRALKGAASVQVRMNWYGLLTTEGRPALPYRGKGKRYPIVLPDGKVIFRATVGPATTHPQGGQSAEERMAWVRKAYNRSESLGQVVQTANNIAYRVLTELFSADFNAKVAKLGGGKTGTARAMSAHHVGPYRPIAKGTRPNKRGPVKGLVKTREEHRAERRAERSKKNAEREAMKAAKARAPRKAREKGEGGTRKARTPAQEARAEVRNEMRADANTPKVTVRRVSRYGEFTNFAGKDKTNSAFSRPNARLVHNSSTNHYDIMRNHLNHAILVLRKVEREYDSAATYEERKAIRPRLENARETESVLREALRDIRTGR